MSTPHVSPAVVVFIVIAAVLILFGAIGFMLCRHVFHFQRENYGKCGAKPCPGFARASSEKPRISTTTRCPPPISQAALPESPALGFVSDEKFFPRNASRSNSDLERLLPSTPRLVSVNTTGLSETSSTTLQVDSTLTSLPLPVTHAIPSKPKSRKPLFLNLFSKSSQTTIGTTTTTTATMLENDMIPGFSPTSPASVRVSVTVTMPQSPSSAHCRSMSSGSAGGGGRIASRTPLPLHATQSR